MVSHSPVFQILLQIEVRMSIMASSPAWTNSAGMLSTLADFPIFSALTAASTSSRRIECYSSSGICGQSSTIGLHWIGVLNSNWLSHFKQAPDRSVGQEYLTWLSHPHLRNISNHGLKLTSTMVGLFFFNLAVQVSASSNRARYIGWGQVALTWVSWNTSRLILGSSSSWFSM